MAHLPRQSQSQLASIDFFTVPTATFRVLFVFVVLSHDRRRIVIGSLPRECLDHVIVWNERSLRRHLQRCLIYYHEWRTHLSLDKDAPVPRVAQPPALGAIVQVPHVGGLHHHYGRRAA
jgi:hypothetical protein